MISVKHLTEGDVKRIASKEINSTEKLLFSEIKKLKKEIERLQEEVKILKDFQVNFGEIK